MAGENYYSYRQVKMLIDDWFVFIMQVSQIYERFYNQIVYELEILLSIFCDIGWQQSLYRRYDICF